MNNDTQVLRTLKNLGLIDANLARGNGVSPEINNHKIADNDPWFLQVFFGFCGVIASVLFIGFLTLLLWETALFNSSFGLFIIGTVLSTVGWGLFKNRRTRHSSFWTSLAFAISAAGQLYILFALVSADLERPLNIWLFLLFQVVMTLIMPNFIYRLLSSMAALGGLVYLLGSYQLSEISLGLLALITIVMNLQRYELLRHVPSKWRLGAFEISKALMYASAFILLVFSVYVVAGEDGYNFLNRHETFYYNYVLAQGLLILASLYAVYRILKRYDIELFSKYGAILIGVTIALGITSIYVAGLLATSLIIIIAMANSQRTLLGVGIFALVCYVFWYYYQLDTSLLVKSASMLAVGVVLLLLRWLLVKRYLTNDLSASEALIDSKTNLVDSEEPLS